MGRSDSILRPFYYNNISPKGRVALLGFSNNYMFDGDLYDLSLGNWNINDENWELNGMYDTIISLRCPYFSKDPSRFVDKCCDHVNSGGEIILDWGLGDHWRFEKYKVGWVKDGEHEYAYEDDNFLWSCFWDDSFETDDQVKIFKDRIEKFGYFGSLGDHIRNEVPSILSANELIRGDRFSEIGGTMLSLWEDFPQIYILLKMTKK